MKLIEIDDVAEEVYNLSNDPDERENLIADAGPVVGAFELAIDQMVQRTSRERDAQPAGAAIDLESDELLRQRLRGLGYLE